MKGKSQLVYDYIENKILLDEYKPGSKIPSEAKLCKELDVSRVSVRSGIEKLIAVGLLQKEKNAGATVSDHKGNYLKSVTPVLKHNFNYHQMLELRYALDSLSIELCMDNINDKVIKELQKLIEEMKEYKEDDDFFIYDKKFHMTISKYSKNQLLHNINEVMWDVLETNARNEYHKIGNEERIVEHTNILNAIINNDRELAKIYSVRHLSRTIKDVKSGE